jgi:hypothetical protein
MEIRRPEPHSEVSSAITICHVYFNHDGASAARSHVDVAAATQRAAVLT